MPASSDASSGESVADMDAVLIISPFSYLVLSAEYICASAGEENSSGAGKSLPLNIPWSKNSSLMMPSSAAADSGFS